ncbi:MAG: hypothetical protein HY926_10755 [Elusimicrobia bacterium]|nr:hypothetical protein [Elusimicrobiota bacterium]
MRHHFIRFLTALALMLAGATTYLLAKTGGELSLPASAIPAGSVPAVPAPPAAAPKSDFEKQVATIAQDVRASRERPWARDIRGLAATVARLSGEVLELGNDWRRLDDVEWRMSTLARRIGGVRDDARDLALSAPPDKSLAGPAKRLHDNARDLAAECRRLETFLSEIRAQRGYSPETADFEDDVAQARRDAEGLEAESKTILKLVQ